MSAKAALKQLAQSVQHKDWDRAIEQAQDILRGDARAFQA
jgi:hypothetical protein